MFHRARVYNNTIKIYLYIIQTRLNILKTLKCSCKGYDMVKKMYTLVWKSQSYAPINVTVKHMPFHLVQHAFPLLYSSWDAKIHYPLKISWRQICLESPHERVSSSAMQSLHVLINVSTEAFQPYRLHKVWWCRFTMTEFVKCEELHADEY
jgi:hypothetical protein